MTHADDVFEFLEAQINRPDVSSSNDQAQKAYEDLTHLAVHAREAQSADDKAAFLAAVVGAAQITARLDRAQLLMVIGHATAELADAIIREGRHVVVDLDPGEEL